MGACPPSPAADPQITAKNAGKSITAIFMPGRSPSASATLTTPSHGDGVAASMRVHVPVARSFGELSLIDQTARRHIGRFHACTIGMAPKLTSQLSQPCIGTQPLLCRAFFWVCVSLMPSLDATKPQSKSLDRALSLIAAFIVVPIIMVARY
jgi:hypothetical protein